MTMLILVSIVSSSFWIVHATPVHQEGDHDDDHAPGQCHHDSLLEIVMTHVEYLTSFDQEMEADFDTAIATLYEIGDSLQSIALDCGYPPPETDEHSGDEMHMGDEEHNDMDSSDDVDDHSDEHGHEGEETESEAIDEALALGDAERGRELFNTVIPETGNFACATCHYVDRDDQLVGPGLLSTGRLDHDPSAHNMADMGGDMADDGHMDDAHDEHMDATDEPMMDEEMVMHGDPGIQVIAYIRTSILEPNSFIVPGFPESLMPQIYGEIFSEQDINDIVAYILSLSR